MSLRIAALLTCYNRKDKTIRCLEHLFEAYKAYKDLFELSVYLTDDGSSDGTEKQIAKQFPSVKIFSGDGTLFWAGGMRNSWDHASKDNYDIYFLLNDDTNVTDNLFEEMMKTHEYSLRHYGLGGVYIGSTRDPKTGHHTYGGAMLNNKILNTYREITPNGTFRECNLGNGNIMFVSANVVRSIGILAEGYTHGIADFDYTLTAHKHGIPVIIMPEYCGECTIDKPGAYKKFVNLPLSERVRYLKSPVGLAFNDNLRLMRRHFLHRLPLVFFTGWFKVLFPKVYLQLNKLR